MQAASPLHQQHQQQSQRDQVLDAPLGPLDPLNVALQRVRELELELAQTKLAHVEAECKNQDLNHQLNTTLTEIQSNRNSNSSSWQPWLSKTINTIQEKVATRRDLPTFQSYTGPAASNDSLVTTITPVNSSQATAALGMPVLFREAPKRVPTKERLSSTSSLSRGDYDKTPDVSLTMQPSRNSLK